MRALATLSCAIAIASVSACSDGQVNSLPPQGGETTSVSRLSGSGYKLLYRFRGGANGQLYSAPLVALKGTIYGTVPYGGQDGEGAVFALDSSGKERTLYSFKGKSDGALPYAGLTELNGVFYGTTLGGGAYGRGTVFSITISGKEEVIYSFRGNQYDDGSNPEAGLVLVNGVLYGTTVRGGISGCGYSGCGTVYSVTIGGKEKIVYAFKGGDDGSFPYDPLVQVKGVLYGTTNGTEYDSGAAWGTVFSVTTSGHEKVLHRFVGPPDGAFPYSGLAEINGILYGTTLLGGTSGWGTVFAVATSGKEHILHSFKGGPSDGARPYGALTAVNGILYGTTEEGNGNYECYDGCGTIFSITKAGAERLRYVFRDNPDGARPFAALTAVGGTLYGTTADGGYGYGTVFRISP